MNETRHDGDNGDDPPVGGGSAAGSASASAISARLHAVATGNALWAKGLRFGLVGVGSGLIFAAVTAVLVSGAGFGGKLASGCAYIASLPLNFVGHRNFSFRSEGAWLGDAARFCAVHAVNLAVTMGAMAGAIDGFGLHYAFGIFGAVVLVPVTNFLLMNIWVFKTLSRHDAK